MAKIVIVGGGMAGLTAAYRLGKAQKHEVSLFEAGPRLGGKVASLEQDGFLIEQGPDAVFTRKPWACDLADELGMADEWMEAVPGEFSILVKGKLHHVPRALSTLMPSASDALEQAGFLSAAAKKRFLAEKDAPKGSGEDETVASFFRRRFGKTFSTLVAEPLLAGVHAGDPERLSMKALYPGYLGLEQKHGNLSAPPPPPSSGTKRPAFLALRYGMGSLADRVAANLTGVDVHLNEAVTKVTSKGITANKEHAADVVILAIPAYVASKLLQESAPDAAIELKKIRHVSTAVVNLAYPADQLPKSIKGNGFLVPNSEKCDITGCTFASNKWPFRAPDGVSLIRVFLGRDGGYDVLAVSPGELISVAKRELARICQVKVDPTFVHVDVWPNGMPQYELGHLEILDAVAKGLNGLPVQLIGCSYRGNGVPDCVRQGMEAADAILKQPL